MSCTTGGNIWDPWELYARYDRLHLPMEGGSCFAMHQTGSWRELPHPPTPSSQFFLDHRLRRRGLRSIHQVLHPSTSTTWNCGSQGRRRPSLPNLRVPLLRTRISTLIRSKSTTFVRTMHELAQNDWKAIIVKTSVLACIRLTAGRHVNIKLKQRTVPG